MRLSCVLLATAVTLLTNTDAVSAAKHIEHPKISPLIATDAPLESTTKHNIKRNLRTAKPGDEVSTGTSITDEERMFIYGVFGKIIAAGEKPMAATRAMKKPQEYQQWIAAGLSPSAVRVDVMKIPPWIKNRALAL
ncbi:hypothetical protein PHYBOEH_009724 [Phytophthora boehmeriae]|uniref:RxLR effector protein n=1 Tax=Phytophthora boehmeriae TaxID=109152 RepID=A0A8T1VSL8_9STRA|nr:hypothetical protein PHYBOEH_009724 [Phytophthora boehmeriae]